MSERKTFTLEDNAVSCLSALRSYSDSHLSTVSDGLVSSFVSDLIIAFFEGHSLLANPNWGFLSGLVAKDREVSEEMQKDKEVSQEILEISSISVLDDVALERERLTRVLSRLSHLDFASRSSLSDFLSDPEVRVGGIFDMKFSELVIRSGRKVVFSDQSIVFSNGWEFMSFIPLHFYMNSSDSLVSDILIAWSQSSFDKYYLPKVVSSLLSLASDQLVSDLEFTREYGMTRCQYASYIDSEKKALEKERKAKAEEALRKEALRKAEEWEKKKSYAWASAELQAKRRISNGCASSSVLFNRCSGKIMVGYFVDPESLKTDLTYPLCEKHFKQYLNVQVLTEKGYKFVSQ